MQRPLLSYGGLAWLPLSACRADAVACALESAELARWLTRPGEPLADALARRVDSESAGTSLILVGAGSDGRARTLAGLSEYWELDSVQTWSYVREDLWGRGLNGVNYAVVWALAHDVCGRGSMVVSIDERNARSVAAHRKLFPAASEERVLEPWVPRTAVRLIVTEGPAGPEPLDPAQLDGLDRLVAALPAVARWRARVPKAAPA